MKKRLAGLGLFLLISVFSIATVKSEMKIERVWSESDMGFALVTYTNDSGRTFGLVIIQCTALGEGDK